MPMETLTVTINALLWGKQLTKATEPEPGPQVTMWPSCLRSISWAGETLLKTVSEPSLSVPEAGCE